MAYLTEYDFPKFECTASVDRLREVVIMCERGGWSRCYSLSFKELAQYATQWNIIFDLNKSDKIVAKVATTIILANNAVEHGLDPFRYVPKSKNVTHPNDLETIAKFESLFKSYKSEHILSLLNDKTKEKIKNTLNNIS